MKLGTLSWALNARLIMVNFSCRWIVRNVPRGHERRASSVQQTQVRKWWGGVLEAETAAGRGTEVTGWAFAVSGNYTTGSS